MEYRQLGNSGVRVSVIGMGTNQFGNKVSQEEVHNIIDAAIDLGINFIDTADVYAGGRSEEFLGHALKGKWDRFVVATKVYFKTGEGPNDYGASRYHIMNGVEASLRRLQTDHIDLYQIHRWDATTPIEETMRALDDLVRSGKVRYVGASAFASWQLAKANLLAAWHGWSPFVTVQSHYHMLEREVEREVIPYCEAHGVGFIPYFPLAGGFLTGKYRRGEPAPPGSRGETSSYVQKYMTDDNYTKVEQLTAWAEARGHTMGELAHAWLLAQPQVCSVISGLTRLEHLQMNAQAADWSLSPKEVAEVNEILEGKTAG
ncbi:MAG: aldo/keto reductase [Chloroflexi bacterium]|nr:MAG: aldo/keto reductase [Chloroflexota bacterium]